MMGIEIFKVPRDQFEPDDRMPGLRFPCNVCKHRHGTDAEEPCIRCDWNLNSKSDDELTQTTEFDGIFCECQTEADEEEMAGNRCKSCGRQII